MASADVVARIRTVSTVDSTTAPPPRHNCIFDICAVGSCPFVFDGPVLDVASQICDSLHLLLTITATMDKSADKDIASVSVSDASDASPQSTIPFATTFDHIVSTGRGGAGNIRASSKTRGPNDVSDNEAEARERSRERSRDRGHAAGRGGAGNFRSASKDPGARIREVKEEEEAHAEEVRRIPALSLPPLLIILGVRIILAQGYCHS